VTGTPQDNHVFSPVFNVLYTGGRRAMAVLMSAASARFTAPFLLLSACVNLPAGQSFVRAAAETNVNQRYTIESVSIAGVRVEDAKLSPRLRQRLNALVGNHCDVALLDDVAVELRKELHLREVKEHLLRGSQPDRIRVNFDVVKKAVNFDVSVPKFLYHSKQGWSAEADASTHIRQNTFTLGVVRNGDDLTERFTGFTARYEDAKVGSDKVRFGIGFEDYHEQWDEETRAALPPAGTDPSLDLYRTRRNIAPEMTFALNRNLTVSAGASFEQMQSENPAMGTHSANALTGDIHYRHKIEGDATQQTIDGRYSLRAGTRGLGSDYSYSRHMVSLRYEVKSGRQVASDEFVGGSIAGNAPLFERFVLGGSSTLRGWDRYAIDPLGGSRVVHNSMSYGYQVGEGTAEVFYDSGALWHSNRAVLLRHSLGVGYRQGIFVLTMAFPVVGGKVAPVFMAGMNY
jgi:hypothetical protein